MVNDDATHASDVSQESDPTESGKDSAEKTTEDSKDRVSPEEMLSELSGEPTTQETESESKSDPSKEEEEEDEGDDSPTPPQDENLETFLEEDVPDVELKKKSRFPEFEEGDVVKESDGSYTINSKHIQDDFNNIFGLDNKNADLSLFLKMNNGANSAKKRGYLDTIAEMANFDSRHSFAAAIERLTRVKSNDDYYTVLQDEFPEWSWNQDVPLSEVPIKMGSSNKVEKKAELHGKEFPWSNSELDGAINGYVADNDKISKQDILKSAKLMKLLHEYSDLSKDGKTLSAKQVLDMAIPQANIKKSSAEKEVSLGGGTRVKAQSTKKETPSDLIQAAKEMGLDPEAVAAHLSKS